MPARPGSQGPHPGFSDACDLGTGQTVATSQSCCCEGLNELLMLLKCVVWSKEAVDQGSV